MSRRRFLTTLATSALAGAAWPSVLPAAVLGRGGAVAPSERITFATIGLGPRNQSNLAYFLEQPDLKCVAVCDCFAERRQIGKRMVDEKYGNTDCVPTRFHEELLARPDIDFLLIATGDRWHTQLSILAARAGKDVYCEKPFSLTLAEGRTLVQTMQRYGTVWQCGMQRRSNESYRFVVEAIRAGRIGRLKTITTFLGPWRGSRVPVPEPMPDPDVFDYDRWLGPAPWAPYSPVRVASWRNHWNTSGGVIVDMGPHYFDFAQWAHNSEYAAPVEFEGTATWFDDGFSTVPKTIEVEARYADGVRLLVRNGDKGVRFDGDEGWIHLSDLGVITAEPESILRARGKVEVNWSNMGGHVRNFIDCLRTRRQPASNPELAQRAHTLAHCANLCLRLGRKVRWNPETEQFVNDPDANNMLFRTRRVPWDI